MLWQEIITHAPRILERLQKHGFSALRCIADGVVVVSAYRVLEASDIVQAARGAAPYYPHTQKLEVYGVRADVGGAVTKHIVTFTAQAVPLERPHGGQEVAA